MQNNNNETKINFMNLLPSFKTGKVTLDFGSLEISIDINVNRKGNIVKQVANKIIEEIQDKTDDKPVVDEPVIDKSNLKECHHEDETGWFKGTFRYGGETKSSLHYYEDGIAVCDTGVVSRNHILSENHIKVDDPNTVDCCKKCQAVLAKRKPDAHIELKNDTGWYLRMADSRRGVYKHFYKNGVSVCKNLHFLTSRDKETSLDCDNEYKICKVCLEKAKAESKADMSNKTFINTLVKQLSVKDIIKRWDSKLVKLDNPVPLDYTEGDDIYVEAAKRSLIVNRKSINNVMRKLSSDNRITVDNTNVKFYCRNKIVEFNVHRNPNLKNSELSIRKLNVVDRTSPNQNISGNAYDMSGMVARIILERGIVSNNEKED